MTLRTLSQLAAYHRRQAQDLADAASVFDAPHAAKMKARAADHARWADGLEELGAAFRVLSNLNTHDKE